MGSLISKNNKTPDTVSSGLCGCGKPVRYLVPGVGLNEGACNKYARCATWEELREQNQKMLEQLETAKEYCRDLLGCWAWKKGERAGNAEEYEALVSFIEQTS